MEYYITVVIHYKRLVNEMNTLVDPLMTQQGAIATDKKYHPTRLYHITQVETSTGEKEMLTRDASLCCVCDVLSRQYRFYPIRNNLSHRPEVFPTSLEKKHLMPVAFPLFDPDLIAQGFHIEAAGNAVPCQNLDF